MREFTAVVEQADGWWISWVEELPGAFGQGRELDEARASLREAIALMLDELREESIERTEGESNEPQAHDRPTTHRDP